MSAAPTLGPANRPDGRERENPMENNSIADAMKRFVLDDGADNGLMIADLPTGIGKTYQACRMMLDVASSSPGRRFIFITEQVKNLPADELEEMQRDHPGVSVLLVRSNTDCVLGKAFSENVAAIRDFLADNGEDEKLLTELNNARRSYNNALRGPDRNYRDWTKIRLDEAEAAFRNGVRRALRKKFQTKAARLRAVNEDLGCRWVSEVYPVVNFDSADVVLMTDSKFLKNIDTIVGTGFTLWSETDFVPDGEGGGRSRLSGRCVVIDEFDAFKKVIVQDLTSGTSRPIDSLRAFRFIHSRLSQWESLPRVMLEERGWWSKHRKTSIPDRFRNLLEYSRSIQSQYHLEYMFKKKGYGEGGRPVDETPAVSYIFHDCRQFSVGNAITVKTDEGERYNRVMVARKPTSKCYRFAALSNMIANLFDQLAFLVRDLALNYRYNIIEDGCESEDERASYQSCLSSVIDVFDMDRDLSEFVKSAALHRSVKFTDGRDLVSAECTPYSKGFSYVCLEDSNSAQFQTKLSLTTYDVTPELVLRHMCERTKVIGLSATAGVRSPVCNFSMDYLRDVGVRVTRFEGEDAEGVARLAASNAAGFGRGDAELHVQAVDVEADYGEYSWERIVGEDAAYELYSRVNAAGSGDSDFGYVGRRYVRAARAVDFFAGSPGVQSMICFFNASLRPSADSRFRTGDMDLVLNALEEKHGVRFNRSWNGPWHKDTNPGIDVVAVESSNSEDELERVKARLGEGRKVLVITAYRTLGAGQNLQYPVPAGSEPVWVREGEPRGGEKDFDAIYLDSPTNVAPMITFGDRGTLDRYLFFVEDMDAANEISLKQKYEEVRNAFTSCYGSPEARSPQHFKYTDAYYLAKAQAVMQAVGRMSRTGWRSRDTYILYDPELASSGAFSLDRGMYGTTMGYEFGLLYDMLHAPPAKEGPDPGEKASWEAVRRTHNFVGWMDSVRGSMYRGHGASIELWKAIRAFALRNPTAARGAGDDDYTRRLVRYGYIEPPTPSAAYWFTKRSDFDDDSTDELRVSFDGPGGGKGVWYKVCPESANLDMLAQIQPVRAELERAGAPLAFESGECVMGPYLFQAVYMGALGELAGRAILRDVLGVELEELDREVYERFDYRLGDLYFDFKNWVRTRHDDPVAAQREVDSARRKLRECGGRRAYVVNIVFDQDREVEPVHVTDLGDGMALCEVPYLYRFVGGDMRLNAEFIDMLERDILGE